MKDKLKKLIIQQEFIMKELGGIEIVPSGGGLFYREPSNEGPWVQLSKGKMTLTGKIVILLSFPIWGYFHCYIEVIHETKGKLFIDKEFGTVTPYQNKIQKMIKD